MPLFAIAHAYAFCRLDDYGSFLRPPSSPSFSFVQAASDPSSALRTVDPSLQYVARMPFLLALRDAAGLLDVYFDFKATAQGRGMSYRSFEPAEGAVHTLGLARERRIRAGLRYEGGGKGSESSFSFQSSASHSLRLELITSLPFLAEYWLPVPRGDGGILGGVGRDYGSLGNSVNPPLPPTVGVYNRNGHGPHSKGYHSPPLPSSSANSPPDRIEDSDDDTDSVTSLEFFDLPNDTTSTNGDREELEVEKDEKLYEHARSMLHGDWAYRVVDVSREEARRKMREEEENVLRGYGRDGRGRRRGEVWGRGLPGRRGRGEVDGEGSGVAEGKKKDTRKVYGAYDDEERLSEFERVFMNDEPDDATDLLPVSLISRPSRQHLPFHRSEIEEDRTLSSSITSERTSVLSSSHLRRRRRVSHCLATSHRTLHLLQPLPSLPRLSSAGTSGRSYPPPLDLQRKGSRRPPQGSRVAPAHPSNLPPVLSPFVTFGISPPSPFRYTIVFTGSCAGGGRSCPTGRCGGLGR